MPKANKFTALGKGNGFARCIDEKLNVSSYDAVQPLTLAQAMKIYWNLHGATGFFKFPTDQPGPPIINVNDINDQDFIDYSFETGEINEDNSGTPTEPKGRVCNPPFAGINGSKGIDGNRGFSSFGSDLNLEDGLVRYYNGDISDEDNFIGYGYFGLYFVRFAGVETAGNSNIVLLATHFKESQYGSYSPESSVVTFDSIPMLKIQTNPGNGLTGANVTGLDFYTY
tara:strand:- start:31 stop:708 length:678 start_codon:yes stop_codon:yes gene_type:complete